MADLARNHTDRQIWITRSHLAALGITTLFIAILSFFIGLKMGQNQAGPATAATPPPPPVDEEEDVACGPVDEGGAPPSTGLHFRSAAGVGLLFAQAPLPRAALLALALRSRASTE